MTKNILKERIKENLNDYGDIYILKDEKDNVRIKDGEGNFFEIKITKM
jgi:hypothetical protein